MLCINFISNSTLEFSSELYEQGFFRSRQSLGGPALQVSPNVHYLLLKRLSSFRKIDESHPSILGNGERITR